MITSKKFVPNELHPALLGPASLNPFQANTSASRGQMYSSSHLGQMLVIADPDVRRIQTGMEREYGKYTFKIEMPCNGRVIDMIPRYQPTLGANSINHNPQTVVIYEDVDTGVIGMVDLVEYSCNHQYFGYRYKDKPHALNQLHPGADIPKGTIFRDSPNVTDDGDYRFGLNANIAYMTMPGASEDGAIIADDFAKRMAIKVFETRVIEWGHDNFALNLYGDPSRPDEYKPFPDIGETIKEHGVLMALRPVMPPELAIVEQSIHDVREIDDFSDNCVYVNGPGGKVIDIKVHHDLADYNVAPVNMDGQIQKYDQARRVFYRRIVETWRKLYKRAGRYLQLTPEFHSLVVHALSVTTQGRTPRVVMQHRKAPLDLYRVEITVEYDITPGIGFKVTDCHGGKGVICKVVPREHMPVDADGNSADIVMDPNATINRSNPGRQFEQYFSASARDTWKRLCARLGVEPKTRASKALPAVQKGLAADPEAWLWLLRFYEIISPRMRAWFFETGQEMDGTLTDAEGRVTYKGRMIGPKVTGSVAEYVAEIVEHGIYLFVPTDNQPMSQDIVRELEREELGYKPIYGPVSYVGNSGKRVTTFHPVRVAEVYLIELEKIGDDWNSVSSGKLQHHGVLSQLTKNDKYAYPARNNAVRVVGEAEGRIFAANLDTRELAEIMDLNNNPNIHRVVVDGILSADQPGNIESLVDRNIYPFGGAKPLLITKHLLQTGGIDFEFTPYGTSGTGRGIAVVTSNREAKETLKDDADD